MVVNHKKTTKVKSVRSRRHLDSITPTLSVKGPLVSSTCRKVHTWFVSQPCVNRKLFTIDNSNHDNKRLVTLSRKSLPLYPSLNPFQKFTIWKNRMVIVGTHAKGYGGRRGPNKETFIVCSGEGLTSVRLIILRFRSTLKTGRGVCPRGRSVYTVEVLFVFPRRGSLEDLRVDRPGWGRSKKDYLPKLLKE